MKKIIFLFALITSPLILSAQQTDLSGTWVPTKECGIRRLTLNKDSTAVIELKNMTLGDGETQSGIAGLVESPTIVTYRMDWAKSPKWITFTVTQVSTGEESQMEGIFMVFRDDRFKMYVSLEEGKPRPDSFIPVTSPDIVIFDKVK